MQNFTQAQSKNLYEAVNETQIASQKLNHYKDQDASVKGPKRTQNQINKHIFKVIVFVRYSFSYFFYLGLIKNLTKISSKTNKKSEN
jgi:hypothetical protein